MFIPSHAQVGLNLAGLQTSDVEGMKRGASEQIETVSCLPNRIKARY